MKILCDTHSHTIASTHAYSTIHDYIRDAKQVGLQLISITDHAPTMPDAPHYFHFGNMKVIPRVIDNIAVLRGIEANILDEPFQKTGRYVDIPDYLLPALDVAIGSFHEQVIQPGSVKENTHAMIRAIKSGAIQIVGHPGNPKYQIDQDEVVRAAKDHNVLMEINNSSFLQSRNGSEPYCTSLIETVDKHDWKISLGSDAHISFDVGNFSVATEVLVDKGFNPDRIATLTPHRFLEFLAEHGKQAADELKGWAAGLTESC